eukprot:10090367-Karenia_brevis.AAC.1
MRDTARMMKASSPGAPPGAVAHRRYPDVPVYSVSDYESRQSQLRASREREHVERFEDQDRMREAIGIPVCPALSTRRDPAPQPPTPPGVLPGAVSAAP